MAGRMPEEDIMAGKKKLKVNVKELTEKKDPTYSYSDFIRELRSKVSTDDSDRATWKNKMIIATNQRLGIKRYSNYPYPGAPDIPLPETDKLIKKAVPNLVLSAYSPKKKCIVSIKQGVMESPELKDKQSKTEDAMNMVLDMPEVGLFRKLMIAADNMKHYGHCIFRVFEEFKSRWIHKIIDLEDFDPADVEMIKSLGDADLRLFLADRYGLDTEDKNDAAAIKSMVEQFRKGKTIIDFDIERIESYPQFEVIDPLKIIVPAYAEDINKVPRVTYEYYLTRNDIEVNIEKGIFKERELDRLTFAGGTNKNDYVETQKMRNEGISDNTSQKDLYRINEICCWYKGEKDKFSRRRVITVLADCTSVDDAILQDIAFPCEYDGWFYEKADNETKDKRYYSSRGLPEQIRALQEISERCINNIIIRDEFNNTPIYEVLDTSEILDVHQRLTPGQKLPVKQIGGEIAQLNKLSSVDMSSERLMATLKAYTEEYQSSADQLFRNATNAGGGKTLGEIQVGMQQNSGPLNLDIMAWNDTLGRVYTKMFYIMQERLGESIHINGKEVTKEDFNFPADIRSNGSLEISNSQFATQKAWLRLQAIINPAFVECVNADDKFNALTDWLEKDGVKDPTQFCTDPKEIAQTQIAKMQGQIKQMQQGMMQMEQARTQGVKDLDTQQQKTKDEKAKADNAREQTNQAGQALEAVGNELFSARG
jgi:hypothetical protein